MQKISPKPKPKPNNNKTNNNKNGGNGEEEEEEEEDVEMAQTAADLLNADMDEGQDPDTDGRWVRPPPFVSNTHTLTLSFLYYSILPHPTLPYPNPP